MSEQTLQDKLRTRICWNTQHENISLARNAADRIDELERQLAEAQKGQADARRYRWLRDDAIHTDFEAPLAYIFDAENNNLEILNDKKLDQAIDAAMQKVKL